MITLKVVFYLQGEKLLLERLMKLSHEEMRILIFKYFQKVIDYRESGRKMEVQITELEVCNLSLNTIVNYKLSTYYLLRWKAVQLIILSAFFAGKFGIRMKPVLYPRYRVEIFYNNYAEIYTYCIIFIYLFFFISIFNLSPTVNEMKQK